MTDEELRLSAALDNEREAHANTRAELMRERDAAEQMYQAMHEPMRESWRRIAERERIVETLKRANRGTGECPLEQDVLGIIVERDCNAEALRLAKERVTTLEKQRDDERYVEQRLRYDFGQTITRLVLERDELKKTEATLWLALENHRRDEDQLRLRLVARRAVAVLKAISLRNELCQPNPRVPTGVGPDCLYVRRRRWNARRAAVATSALNAARAQLEAR